MKYFELKKAIERDILPVSAENFDYEAGKIVCCAAEIGSAELFKRYHDEAPYEIIKKCDDIVKRRLAGIPLEYVVGKVVFFGLELEVTADVLIPRADTERVCEKALALLRQGGRFADVCCGSGNIAAALLSRSDTRADLFDVSEKAAAVAQKNVDGLGLSSRAEIFVRDVFSDGFFDGRDKYDIIISNPPYIKTDVIKTLSEEVRREPYIALDGGEDGMIFYRRLLDICPEMLNDGGKIVFEIGYDQASAIGELCRSKGFGYEIFKDYGGNDRVCVITPR